MFSRRSAIAVPDRPTASGAIMFRAPRRCGDRRPHAHTPCFPWLSEPAWPSATGLPSASPNTSTCTTSRPHTPNGAAPPASRRRPPLEQTCATGISPTPAGDEQGRRESSVRSGRRGRALGTGLSCTHQAVRPSVRPQYVASIWGFRELSLQFILLETDADHGRNTRNH
jgi:hypothetical protein